MSVLEHFRLSDGRVVKVAKDETLFAAAVCKEFLTSCNAAIAEKGAFSVMLTGDSVVGYLSTLAKDTFDASRVHVFFCNECIGKWTMYQGALKSFVEPFGIPASQVHQVADTTAPEAAAAYESLLASQSDDVVAKLETGMPSVDLILLEASVDGHVASLYPGAEETRQDWRQHEPKAFFAVSSLHEASVCVSLDCIRAARKVVLAAASGEKSSMVARALRVGCASTDTPASMVNAAETTWICDVESISEYKTLKVQNCDVSRCRSFWDIPGMKPGVITGDVAWNLLRFAKAKHVTIPAFSCTSTSTINAVLEAAKKLKRPIIVQFSESGAAALAGMSLNNDNKQASVLGAVAGAHYVRAVAPMYCVPVIIQSDNCSKTALRWLDGMLDFDKSFFDTHGEPLFTAHGLDLSAETVEENLAVCRRYFQCMVPLNLILEMEVGMTYCADKGEANEKVDQSSTSEDVWKVWEHLSPISEKFLIAVATNVVLKPELLAEFQVRAGKILGVDKPYHFVLHGSSGSERRDLDTDRRSGVVKLNVDTDTQWAYWEGLLKFYERNEHYLQQQLGNTEGPAVPNKTYYDPRRWLREAEVAMVKRVEKTCIELRNCNCKQQEEADWLQSGFVPDEPGLR